MATVTESPPETTSTSRIPLDGDTRVQIPATWNIYTELCELRGDKSRPRYVFVDGRLTVVSPGIPHEGVKTRLGGLIEDVLVGLRIEAYPLGSVTLLRSLEPLAAAEADETYFLTNLDRIRGKDSLVMGVDPGPDLGVEVVVSHLPGDSLECHRLFGVREVWLVEDGELSILVLSENGLYEASLKSVCFPFLTAQEMAHWAFRQDIDNEIELRFQFRAWVSETRVLRHRPNV